MRFLVLSEHRDQIPADAVKDLMAATDKWIDDNAETVVVNWANAGRPGGGGIINVESLEQLEQIMLAFPLGRYSEVTITPIIDLKESFRLIQQMG